MDGPAASASRVHGRLTLAFAAGCHGTVLRHAEQAAPLEIVRPFPLAGGGLLVQVLTLGPGMCGGDRHTIEVTVEAGARAVIIMQSASRLLAMDEGDHARLDVALTGTLRRTARVLPGPDHPIRGQQLHPAHRRDCRIGRPARPARNLGDRTQQPRRIPAVPRDLRAYLVSVDGLPAYADAMELAPARHGVAGAGVLEGHRYVASGFWHGATLAADDPLPKSQDSLVALGQSGPKQVYLRALAMDGFALGETVQRAVHRIDKAWGQPPVPLRRFTS